jgi:hypothetical protein
MQIQNAAITGSFTYNGIDLSSVTGSTSNITSLNAITASILSTTASLNTASGSAITRLGALEVTSGSNITRLSALETASGSAITRLGALEVTSGSNITRLSALETASGSAITRLGSIEVVTGSNITRLNSIETVTGSNITRLSSLEAKTGSYATTGSNTFVDGQYLSSSFNPTGFSTTASLYTDGGLRVTKDAYISGTLYLNNVTVFGTQSVAYISSSQLNIGTNLITVNTDTPSIRFGGLAVYDSGSTGLTGSILWDSTNNHWVYSNPSGSSYSGGMFISGPRTSTLGSETGTTSCMLLAGQGGDHLTSSMIYHSSTMTCFYSNAVIDSSGIGYFNRCLTIGSLTGSGYRLEVISPSCTTGYVNVFYGLHTGNNTFTIRQFGANHPSAAAVNQIGVLNAEQHLHLVTDDQACIDTGTSTRGIFIKSGGRVGIGMQSPSEKLEICGALKINGVLCSTSLSANSTYIDQTGGTARLLSYGPNSTTRGAITFFQASSTNACQFTGLTLDTSGNATFEGCVGIKCSTPSYTLDVNGTGRFSGIAYFNQQINVGTSTLASNADIGLLTNTGNWYVSNVQASHYFQIYDAQTAAIRLLINTTGDLTLGGTSGVGVGALYAGAATFSGNVTVAKSDAVNDVLLKVQQTANFTAGGLALVANNDGGAGYNFIYSSTNGGTEHWRIGGLGTTSTLSIQTGGATRLTIASTGISSFSCQACAPRITINSGTSGIIDLGQIGTGGVANQIVGGQYSGYAYVGKLSFNVGTWGVGSDYGPTEQMRIEVQGADTKKSQITMAPYGGSIISCGNSYFCGSTYGIMGFGEKVMDKICYIMTTSGTICVPLDGLTYASFPTRAIYLYGTLLDNDAAHYAHMLYFYRNDYGGLQTSTISQASLVHPSTAGQPYTFTVNDPVGIGKGNCTLLLRFTSPGAGVAPGSYCTKMRIVVYNVPGL